MQQKTAFHDKICQQADKLVFVSNRAAVAVECQLECEAKMRNVEDESWDIRKRLAEANMELASLRWSMQVLSDKLEDAAKQLESSSLKGKGSAKSLDKRNIYFAYIQWDVSVSVFPLIFPLLNF